jgi:acyl-CoA reductase-like NAD-dependent aldehyde dehydrogenase
MSNRQDRYPFYLANQPLTPNVDLLVQDKFTGATIASVALATPAHIEQAIAAAVDAQSQMAALPTDQRAQILHFCAAQFSLRQQEFAGVLCQEAGKPMTAAEAEVTRLIETFRLAAEECTRIRGEYLPLADSPLTRDYCGITKRVPIGPCALITPFNFPLNLAAHKIAPAIAAGCAFVLKPASLTPLGALMIGDVLAQADLPMGAFSILPCSRQCAAMFSEDPRLKLLSFTGSAEVGWALKARAGKKAVVLELGGNAACVVDAGVDLEYAVNRMIFGAFYQAGQSCISVQRIYVHRSLYPEFKTRLIQAATTVACGDPALADTLIGPLISSQEADRIQQWIDEALQMGATLLCGNQRHGNVINATLLENVPPKAKLAAEEVFGPVAMLAPFDRFSDVIEAINRSRYGLQVGVFTPSLAHTLAAWDGLDVGGVIINDVPTWRADAMPYGGVKESGLGREGVQDAIEHFTVKRLLVINRQRLL